MIHRGGKWFEIGKVIVAKNCVNVCVLGYVDDLAGAIAFDLDAQHPVQLSEICDFEVHVEAGLEFLDKADSSGDDCAIVHMDYHDSELTLDNNDSKINCLIHSALPESKQ